MPIRSGVRSAMHAASTDLVPIRSGVRSAMHAASTDLVPIRSGVIYAMHAASQLSGRGPTDVDIAPVPAR